ncbi:MAG: GNAT family N-acetyltransferase [Planctomycetaceae bacterium]
MSSQIHCTPIAALQPNDIARWQRLAEHALEANPFQQPDFVLPLLRHCGSSHRADILYVTESNSTDWRAACVVSQLPPTLSRPLRRLRSFRPLHAYLDQPLIDRNSSGAAAEGLLRGLLDNRLGHALRLNVTRLDGPVQQTLQHAGRQVNAARVLDREWRRAAYSRKNLNHDPLAHCSKSRRKSLRRSWRRLEERGQVKFRLVRPATGQDLSVERFLSLEHSGWGGMQGTSLLGLPQDAQFFREMCHAFAQRNQVAIGELYVGGNPIASTFNLVLDETAFAFKIGWNNQFADGSPGMWSELLLPAEVFRQFPQVQRIDGCSQSGSHIESLWPDSDRLGNVVYAWSRTARYLSRVRRTWHYCRRTASTGLSTLLKGNALASASQLPQS